MLLSTARLFILSISLLSVFSQAQDLKSIILADGPIQVNLSNNMQWLKSDHTSLSLAQLLLKPDSQFSFLSDGAVVEEQNIYWLRFKVINPVNHNIPLALTLSSSSINIDGAYEYKNDQWQRIRSIETQQQLSSNTALILNIEALSEQWLYFRVKPFQTSRLEPKLQDLSQYAEGFTVLQQVLGAMVSLMVFIIFLHLVAIRFHNHIRHYLTIFLAFIGFCFNLSHSQLYQWPDWFFEFAKLSPWIIASVLFLSSYSTEQYRSLLKSNRSIFTALTLLLATLILTNLPYLVILIMALIPSCIVLSKIKRISINLSIANFILSFSVLWQVCYIILPEVVFAPEGIWHVYALTLCVLFTSLSMITPYFQRQIKRKQATQSGVQSQFLESLSHELRTPMNGVLGMAELLNDTPLSANQRDYVDTIIFSGHDMLRMVNRVSDFAKVQSGKIQLEKNTIELAALAQRCLSKFQYSANQKGLELVLNIEDDLINNISADEHRLEMLLDNLLENAVRHTEYGEIELKIALHSDTNMLLFAVRDTGTGLDRQALKQLLSNTDVNKKIETTKQGFGISLCKRLIELMGGNLFVESLPDKGSTFSFTIPFESVANAPSTSQNANQILQGLSILIVDDNSTLRKVIQRYANSWGMQSDNTFNGKEALALMRSQNNLGTPYDIVLIDQDMPIMDGFQLAKRIQEDDNIDGHIIKVMLTGMSISNTQKEVIQYGIDQVITKPISAQNLKEVLARHVIKRQTLHKHSEY